MSAFLFYSQDKREAIKAKYPGIKNTEISKMLGCMWREAPSQEKNPYIKHEQQERIKYKVKMENWRKKQKENLKSSSISSDSFGVEKQSFGHDLIRDDCEIVNGKGKCGFIQDPLTDKDFGIPSAPMCDPIYPPPPPPHMLYPHPPYYPYYDYSAPYHSYPPPQAPPPPFYGYHYPPPAHPLFPKPPSSPILPIPSKREASPPNDDTESPRYRHPWNVFDELPVGHLQTDNDDNQEVTFAGAV